MSNILGVIPARGGSKGIPRKNLVPILGKPLIAYTIEAASQSHHLSRFIVSTDDEEIARVSRDWGAEVPFLRPSELATDSALSLHVMQHAILEVERLEGKVCDVAVMLQPTTPLRLGSDIDDGIELLLDSGADSVISVVKINEHHPFRMKRLLEDGRLINYIDQGFEDLRPRQQLPEVYIRNGALYVTRRDVLVKENSFVGRDCRAYVMPEARSINIDTESDTILAEYFLKKEALKRTL